MRCGGRFLNRPIQKSASTLVFVLFALACVTTKPLPPKETSRGIASWYGEEFAGRTTANGEIFDPLQFTAAHRTLPFGTIVDVTNPKTSQTVRVRVNDRGPYIGQRLIDLSYAAAQQIGLIEPGSGEVDIKVVTIGRGDREPPAPYEVKIEAPKEKVVIASQEPPKVDFPLPAATSDPDFRIDVQDQKKNAETRKRVSADGRTIEEVTVNGGVPVAKKPTRVFVPHALKYIVQVGAFSIEANAKDLHAQLARIGQQSFIDHEDLYRVRIGPFATRDQAVKTRTALETSGLSAIIIAE